MQEARYRALQGAPSYHNSDSLSSYQSLLQCQPLGHLHRFRRFIPLAKAFCDPDLLIAIEQQIRLLRFVAKLSGDFYDVVVSHANSLQLARDIYWMVSGNTDMTPPAEKSEATRSADLSDLRAQLQYEQDALKTVGTLWLSWFTVFLTIIAVALGWFITTMVEGKFHDAMPLYVTAANFVSQLVLGIVATQYCQRWARASEDHMARITQRIKDLTPPESHPISFRKEHFGTLLGRVFMLGSIAMAFLTVVWVLLAFHERTHRGIDPHASQQAPAKESVSKP
jgi:hypothetical protein